MAEFCDALCDSPAGGHLLLRRLVSNHSLRKKLLVSITCDTSRDVPIRAALTSPVLDAPGAPRSTPGFTLLVLDDPGFLIPIVHDAPRTSGCPVG